MTQHKKTASGGSTSAHHRPKPRGTGVVLGVSDSAAGRAALKVAVREAAARDVPLHMVRIWEDVAWFPSMTRDSVATMELSEQAGSVTLDEAVHLARELDPAVTLVPEAPAGELFEVLRDRALGADLLVLGSEWVKPQSDDLDNWFVKHVACPVVAVSGSGEVVRGQTYLRAGVDHAARKHTPRVSERTA